LRIRGDAGQDSAIEVKRQSIPFALGNVSRSVRRRLSLRSIHRKHIVFCFYSTLGRDFVIRRAYHALLPAFRRRGCLLAFPGWGRRICRVMFRTIMVVSLLIASTLGAVQPNVAQEQEVQTCFLVGGQNVCIAENNYRADVCTAIEAFATYYQLPIGYFARLIWQESRFDPAAISPAGAQGIAQFMPATGRLRGLVDPFDPAEAMARSAEYLQFLERKYGNLGLAAAAYNGGEARITRYVANGGGALPAETRAYVMIVTSHSVDAWLAGTVGTVDYTLDDATDFHTACMNMAEAVRTPKLLASPGEWEPWGVLIAQSASAEQAQARFTAVQSKFGSVLSDETLLLITVRNPRFGSRTRFSAMIGFPTRQEAQDLCHRLTAAGGNCIVQKNAP